MFSRWMLDAVAQQNFFLSHGWSNHVMGLVEISAVVAGSCGDLFVGEIQL